MEWLLTIVEVLCTTYIVFIAVSRQWSGLIGIDKHDSLLLVLYEVHSLVWFDKYCTVGSLSPMHQLVTGGSDNLDSSFTGTPPIAHLAS